MHSWRERLWPNIALTGLADRAAFSIYKNLILIKNNVAKGPTLKDLKNHQHNNIGKLVNVAKRFWYIYLLVPYPRKYLDFITNTLTSFLNFIIENALKFWRNNVSIPFSEGFFCIFNSRCLNFCKYMNLGTKRSIFYG